MLEAWMQSERERAEEGWDGLKRNLGRRPLVSTYLKK
jgi:hypothetical protein